MRALERDLEVDRVIAERHALEAYGVTLRQARRAGWIVKKVRIGLTYSARNAEEVSLIVWPEDERLVQARVRASTLRHLAGVTAMRLLLGAPACEWVNEGGAPLARHLPDGYWRKDDVYEGAVWAVEYDAGSYSAQQVREKIQAFKLAHGYQIWGIASEARIEWIRSALQSSEAPGQVHYVPWC